MSLNLPAIGDWLGDKLTRKSEELDKEKLDTLTRAELIHTITELQKKLENANSDTDEETAEEKKEEQTEETPKEETEIMESGNDRQD